MHLRLHQLSKSFGPVRAADAVSLDVPDEEWLVLLGPGGSGKTTILRLIAGLEVPDAGGVFIDGKDATHWPPHERGVALVSQRAVLYPHLTARQNLLFGLAGGEDISEAVDLLGLAPLLDRLPHQMSGGQQQRVALGRALVRRASLVLLDEPFASLDSAARWELLTDLPLLRRRLTFTMILVTHEQAEAFALAGRVALLDRGRVLQTGPPQEAHDRPSSVHAARLLGWPPINLFPGVIRQEGERVDFEASGIRLALPPALLGWGRFAGRAVLLGVRPGSLRPGADGWPLDPLGRVPDAGGGWLLARVCGQQATLRDGEGAFASFPPDAAHLFDGDTGEALAHGPG